MQAALFTQSLGDPIYIRRTESGISGRRVGAETSVGPVSETKFFLSDFLRESFNPTGEFRYAVNLCTSAKIVVTGVCLKSRKRRLASITSINWLAIIGIIYFHCNTLYL